MSNQRNTDGLFRIVLVVLAVLLLAPLLMMGFAFPMMGAWGGMMGGYGGYGLSPVWSFGMGLVWLVVIVGGGYLAYRALSGRDGIGSDPALEELRLAYARGDISEEEFDERRARLEGE